MWPASICTCGTGMCAMSSLPGGRRIEQPYVTRCGRTARKVVLSSFSSTRDEEKALPIPTQMCVFQCTAVYSCVLQSIPVYSSVFQCTLVYSSILSCTPVHSTVFQCTPLSSGVLQCTLVYFSVFQCTLVYPGLLYCTLVYSTVP